MLSNRYSINNEPMLTQGHIYWAFNKNLSLSMFSEISFHISSESYLSKNSFCFLLPVNTVTSLEWSWSGFLCLLCSFSLVTQNQSILVNSWREKRLIHVFPRGICTKANARTNVDTRSYLLRFNKTITHFQWFVRSVCFMYPFNCNLLMIYHGIWTWLTGYIFCSNICYSIHTYYSKISL